MGYNKKWWDANREDQNRKQRERYHKNKHRYKLKTIWDVRLERYGVDQDMFRKMLLEQQSCCPLCSTVLDDTASVDHCHTTGKVRGLLCKQCNMGLGMFYDNIETFERIIDYLKRNNDEDI